MFTIAQPDDDVVAEVATAVGPRLSSLVAEDRPDAVAEIDEAYPLWLLSLDAVESGLIVDPDQLGRVARDLGMWHHQILLDGEPAAFARSDRRIIADTPVNVGVVGYSDVAVSIGECVAWTRDNAPDGGEARLLLAPAWYVTALWLIHGDDNYVIVAHRPSTMDKLQHRKLYSGTQFMRLLASESPHRR